MKRFSFCVVIATLGACKTAYSNYCEDAPLHNCQNAVDAATKCASNAECMAPAGVCDLAGTQTCVECTATDDAACTGLEPVCGSDHACRKCEAHGECDSKVCLSDGSCAAPASVAYVDGAAPAGNTACTATMKCNTVTKALAANKPIVKVEGTVDDRVAIQNKNVQLIGGAGAKLMSSSNGTIVTIGGSSVVSLTDLAVADASGATVGFGVQLQPGASGSLSMKGGKITGCREAGVSVGSGTVVIDRSVIASNKGGGLIVANATFKVTNSLIVDNGDPATNGSIFGGVSLESVASNNVFDDNTVVSNRNRESSADSPGVKCSVANFVAKRNIVSSNAQGTTYPAQLQGRCMFMQSFVESGGDGNPLKFADPSQLNYHLTAASPATVRDVEGVTSCGGVDIDGDARPQNGVCDLGADEFKP